MIDLLDKTILVTGGTGFIGSHIVNKLIDKGCFVNIISSNPINLWRINNLDRCNIVKTDITNLGRLERHIYDIRPEIIFHLDAYISTDRHISEIKPSYDLNFMGTRNLLISLNMIDYDLFINTGTCEEYGNSIPPFKETDKERPVSPYSLSKVASTYLCDMVNRIYNKPIITVRPFLTYGPKQTTKEMLIPQLIDSNIKNEVIEITTGEQTRDLIYVEDVADAYIELAKNANKVRNKGIFNIGSGEEIKVKDIVKTIMNKFGNNKITKSKTYRKGEAMRFYSSIDKIKDTINWSPKWNFEDGINSTINWWLQNER